MTEVEELKGTFVICRTSTKLGRGVGPNGTRRSVYGALPSPVMSIVRFWHCLGVLAKLNEYAAADER